MQSLFHARMKTCKHEVADGLIRVESGASIAFASAAGIRICKGTCGTSVTRAADARVDERVDTWGCCRPAARPLEGPLEPHKNSGRGKYQPRPELSEDGVRLR